MPIERVATRVVQLRCVRLVKCNTSATRRRVNSSRVTSRRRQRAKCHFVLPFASRSFQSQAHQTTASSDCGNACRHLD